jgi:anti-sigma regulatory factor (Ser/Thr protein kinase)
VEAAAQRRLDASSDAPGEARTFVMATLFNWGRRTAIPEVQVVASELVTNAVMHAGGEIEMRLQLHNDLLRIEVTDAARDSVPELQPGSPRETGRYGLHIVEAFAQSWGCAPTTGHKTVWAEIDLRSFGS